MDRFVVRIRSSRPLTEDELKSFLEGVGVISERDVDETVADVFDNFLKAYQEFKQQGIQGVRSGEVAKRSGINRTTCIHHLQRLERAGLLNKEDDYYLLKQDSFESLFDEMKKQMLESMNEMEALARKLDNNFRLENKPRKVFKVKIE